VKLEFDDNGIGNHFAQGVRKGYKDSIIKESMFALKDDGSLEVK
jgi:hypothetical protein